MKAKLTSCLALGVSMIACAPSAALAGGDWPSGAAKEYAGTPVPAPIPVPEYDPVWYFRADVGIGFTRGPEASEKGMVFGETHGGYQAEHLYGPSSNTLDGDYDDTVVFAGGVGYRFNDSWRMDVTGESVREQTQRMNDVARAGLQDNTGAPLPGSMVTRTDDRVTSKGFALMFNAYYDMTQQWRSFTPYVGAGLGMAWMNVDRNNTTIETAYEQGVGPTQQFHSTDSASDTKMSFAAMATIGGTYHLSEITDLDLNYRYMHIGGYDSTVRVNGHSSTVETEDVNDHQIRAGLRFNVR